MMSDNPILDDDTIVAAVPEQLTCDLAGDAAILHLPDGMYYGLNETGALLWERMQQPVKVSDLRAFLTETFQVDIECARNDLHALLREMLQTKLIRIHDAAAS